MARIARAVDGAAHHVTQRGNRRMDVFFTDASVLAAMAHHVAKEIGACAAVLEGRVDASVRVVPGELEMAALAHGALRVLSGRERPRRCAPGR